MYIINFLLRVILSIAIQVLAFQDRIFFSATSSIMTSRRSSPRSAITVSHFGTTKGLMGYKRIAPPSTMINETDKPLGKHCPENDKSRNIAMFHDDREKGFNSVHYYQVFGINIPSQFVQVRLARGCFPAQASEAFNSIETVPLGTTAIHEYDIYEPTKRRSVEVDDACLSSSSESSVLSSGSSQIANTTSERIVEGSKRINESLQGNVNGPIRLKSILKVGGVSESSKKATSSRRLKFGTAIVFEYEVESSDEDSASMPLVSQDGAKVSSELIAVSKRNPHQVMQIRDDDTLSTEETKFPVVPADPHIYLIGIGETSKEVKQQASDNESEYHQVSPNFIADDEQLDSAAPTLVQTLEAETLTKDPQEIQSIVAMKASNVRMTQTRIGRRKRLLRFFTQCFQPCFGNSAVAK